jgi:hypothetical protein
MVLGDFSTEDLIQANEAALALPLECRSLWMLAPLLAIRRRNANENRSSLYSSYDDAVLGIGALESEAAKNDPEVAAVLAEIRNGVLHEGFVT